MLHVECEAGESGARLEAGERKLVERDRRKTGKRDGKRVVMKDGNAEQRQAKQDEVDRDAEKIDRRAVCRRCRVRDETKCHDQAEAETTLPLHNVPRVSCARDSRDALNSVSALGPFAIATLLQRGHGVKEAVRLACDRAPVRMAAHVHVGASFR